MIVLFAPDSFKGTLTSVQVARALADGWLRARPDDEILLCPLADGGEGTLEAVAVAGGWEWRTSIVPDPLERPVAARWLFRGVSDRSHAVIEMAEAAGLSRVAPADRDPMAATSLGTGRLLAEAIDRHITHVTLGIGGSATTDGGRLIIIDQNIKANTSVQLLALKSEAVVRIGAGENGGRVVRYTNVVLAETEVGRWLGGSATILIA